MQKIQILASLRRLWRPLFSVYKVLDTIKFEQSSVLLRVNELFLLNLYSFLIFYILQSNLNLFKKKNIFPLSSKEASINYVDIILRVFTPPPPFVFKLSLYSVVDI